MTQPDRVYLDTSFFIGLHENQSGNRELFTKILHWERKRGSQLFTSQLTVNEYLVRYYDKHKRDEDCEKHVREAERDIYSIASVYGISDEVCRKAARYMSVWGELRRMPDPKLPRDRGFRWDAIHLATADTIKVARVYVRDGPWKDFPKEELGNIGELVCPPRLLEPQADLPMELST